MGNDFKDLFGDWRPDDTPPEPEGRAQRPLNEKEVKVVNVWEGILEPQGLFGNAETRQTYFIQLRDNQGREFRIFVLRDMALSISLALENENPDRPFTHDLMKAILERMGATIERVTIDDLWQDTFYAKVVITYNGQTMEIDARPSDAIALALRFRAPIYVAEYVLEAAQHES
ncbi:MAG TPA: bifunctional nuclease family protein [Chthonomonadaceae bacterium]|nr:bifunctional nuclease family protein [Chthonomonadaceae bacterium]